MTRINTLKIIFSNLAYVSLSLSPPLNSIAILHPYPCQQLCLFDNSLLLQHFRDRQSGVASLSQRLCEDAGRDKIAPGLRREIGVPCDLPTSTIENLLP